VSTTVYHSNVTERQTLNLARRVLQDLDDEAALRSNALLAHLRDRAPDHDHLRAYVLRALEQLEPGSRGDALSERRRRQYAILLRCDVQHVAHKQLMTTIGLSRRQFYRDRKTALLTFAKTLHEYRPLVELSEPDTHDVHILYIETLRQRGQFDLVWRESIQALRNLRGDAREVELWTVAAEASRYFGNVRKSREAIDTMRAIAATSAHPHLRRASQLRIAICEAALDWMLADFTSARDHIDDTARACGDERTMYGRDATLFGILLNYGAWIAIDTGDLSSAAEYTRRSERITARSEVAHAAAVLHSLRGRIAMQRDGDVTRASTELRDALAIAKTYRALAPLATAAVELGRALLPTDETTGANYIRNGLAIARDACGFDDYAVLSMRTLPKLPHVPSQDALDSVDNVRSRSPLYRRADLYTRLAEAALRLRAGQYEAAAETSAELARELENASLRPASAEAHVLHAEALLRQNRVVGARRSLKRAHAIIATFGDAATRAQAVTLASFAS
jgi:tetratricopeptide (TPR) repeat protein